MKRRIISCVLAACMLGSAVFAASCSTRLPEETLPAQTADTAPATESTETTAESSEETTEEPTETSAAHGPCSTAVVTERIVDNYGQLSVVGTNLVNEAGEPVQLRGMSSYGMNGMYNFINADTIQTLAEDWGCDIVRFAMYTKGESDGYIQDPEKYFNMMCEYVDLCIDQGIYAIIDWHILYDGDPNEYKAEAIDFFSRISAVYADCPNVIYEICNEPNRQRFDDDTQDVDWENTIRPYAVDVVAAIRENDPDNIIVVGTPSWSQNVDDVIPCPLEGDNIMYTVHFYAGSHGQENRDRVTRALEAGIPVFCTEWGTTGNSGGGELFFDESMEWLDFFEENNISWCNWSIGGSMTESSNALRYVSNILTIEEKLAGHWPDEFLSRSGYFVRSILLYGEYIPPEE